MMVAGKEQQQRWKIAIFLFWLFVREA